MLKSKIEELKKEFDIVAAVVTGSHLFKLDTPKSDVDLLIVYKPPLYDVLMGSTFKKGKLDGKFVKAPGAIEVNLVSLPDFLHRLVNGDIASVEALFGDNLHATNCWDEIVKLRSRAITKNLIQKCFGYARNCIHSFTNADGFVRPDLEAYLSVCKEGDSDNHISLAHNHRVLFELYRYMSLGEIAFGSSFYNADKYHRVKANAFTSDDIIEMIQEMVDMMNLIRSQIIPTTFDNKVSFNSFQPIFYATYGVTF